MTGWLVNDRLTSIPGTKTLWNHLLENVPGLVDKCSEPFSVLADAVEHDAARQCPDYIIRNAAYFRWLNVGCPVVSFVQDILYGRSRELLLESCLSSEVVVFNSEYTKSVYPELAAISHKIISVGTDDVLFSPKEPDGSVPVHSVLWVGSGHDVKGFDLACHLASTSPRPWIFVMKDAAEVPVPAAVYRRISQEALAEIASSCAVGVCTSREETQHLAGIEMGMCGLPLVTTDVGVYHDRLLGAWGSRVRNDWHRDIEAVSGLDRDAVRAYWLDNGFGLDACMRSWNSLVASLETSDVTR